MKTKIKDLENLKSSIPQLDDCSIKHADARCGKKVALVETYSNGACNVITSYMTYNEMECFLRGFMFSPPVKL